MLEIKDLKISFTQYEKGLKLTKLHTIQNLNVQVPPGKIVAIVGASGSGKSLLAHAIMGILPHNADISGTMLYQGEELTKERIKSLRGKEIVLVPQSTAYLNPLIKTGKQILMGRKDKSYRERLKKIFSEYELSEKVAELYPFELSGGMTRRIMLSTALISTPKIVIADEPTPGLHLSAAKRAMGHFRELADKGTGVLVITHDLELAMHTADIITVFYEGKTVETISAEDFIKGNNLVHPYTKALWKALPQNSDYKVSENIVGNDILEAKDISFRYRKKDRKVVDKISLQIKSGEIVGIRGKSGIGKTTLCRLLSGYEEPESGAVILNGKSLPAKGYCPVQMIWQNPEHGVDPFQRIKVVLEEADGISEDLIRRLGIKKEWLERFPRELSGGEIQRFCIARALGKGTKFLIADEISTMLDLVTQDEIWKVILDEVNKRNIGMVVVSHSDDLLKKICSRVWEYD